MSEVDRAVGEELGKHILKAMEKTGITAEQMADILRYIARQLTEKASK